jgi:hypothetical protein
VPGRLTVTAAFNQLDDELNLDPGERDAAQRRHREVTEVLTAAGLAASTFLQGSFARKTMLKPLNDVDMVVLLPPDLVARLRGADGPTAAMRLFADALRQAFPGVRFDVHDAPAHALLVTFRDCPFTFDLVPAYEDPAGGEDVFIANREEGRWERSNTRTLNRVIRDRNVLTGGRFVHQVRFLKQLKTDHPVLDETCGLLWEALAHAAVRGPMSHPQAVSATLRHAAAALGGPVLDPTGVEDLTAEWTPAERDVRQRAVAAAADRATEALKLEADDEHAAAIEVWRELIGDPFPRAAAQSAADALSYLAGGSLTSTGRAVATTRGHQPARPTRSWRSR